MHLLFIITKCTGFLYAGWSSWKAPDLAHLCNTEGKVVPTRKGDAIDKTQQNKLHLGEDFQSYRG